MAMCGTFWWDQPHLHWIVKCHSRDMVKSRVSYLFCATLFISYTVYTYIYIFNFLTSIHSRILILLPGLTEFGETPLMDFTL